ncbi:helix-turn-helix domain-containing protein [Luteimonas terricola]|uniref:XRE family transcriptional regulator n=1 Tax=Luteimonas terricola TaxID=645597 RepID=A0ABQ2EH23_9GAMM|nr:transcriptional regulator [Luteimonas terricola]GGK08885.1 XRE family transcriptional regulator [Luteimonas terricola]
MISSAQMRAARALLGIDQRTLAGLAGVSVPTIQRMEASSGDVRGVIGSLTKVVGALEAAGVELIGDNSPSPTGGRGVRLKAERDVFRGEIFRGERWDK